MAQKRKGRYNVYLDNQYAFPVSENVLVKYRLLKGMEVDEKLRQTLIHADQVDRYYQRAINFLAHRLRTKKEMVIHLRDKEASEDAIKIIIDRLISNHLLNDQNYADSYVRSEVRMSNKGPQTLVQYLRQKGVSLEKITTAISEYYPDETVVKNGVIQAQKLFNNYRHDSHQKALQKIQAALIRKGYYFESINQIMNQVELPFDENQEQKLLSRQFEKIWYRNRNENFIKRCIKTKQSLYRKGFSIDQINAKIDQQNDQ